MARYVFSLIKFVSDDVYANVGAIVGHPPTEKWTVKLVENPSRARSIDSGGSLDRVLEDLRSLQSILTGWVPHKKPTMCQGALWEIYQTWRGPARLTEPLMIEALDETAAFRTVFRFLITDPFQAAPKEKKTVDSVLVLASDGIEVLRGVNRLLKQHGLAVRQKGDYRTLGDQRYLVLEPTE